jgi:hypothetical protein
MIPVAPVADLAPSSVSETDHPLVGHVVAERYRIDALLGEGGMGAVFRARHLALDRPVAIKVLHPHLCADEQIRKRFDREALAISKLDHPNCVQVIDFGTTARGMRYLVMPLLEGQELRELTGVGLPLAQVIDLGTQILRALEHAHKRGLVHRDLKPENIFLVRDDDERSIVKLVDFGIVKLLEMPGQDRFTRLTRAGMAFGTPTYMSPEQATGGAIDERTDLYALGVVLYELLTGRPPFEADEPGILLRMQILSEPPPLPDTVPESLAAVVMKLLSKDPGHRHASAREAREALVAAGEGRAAAPSMDASALALPSTAAVAAPAIAPTGPAPDAVVVVDPALAPTELAIASSSGGTLPSGSMSQEVVLLGPASSGVAALDAFAASGSGMLHVAPSGGTLVSGGHALPGTYRVAAMPRSARERRGGLVLLVVALALLTWVALAWLWTSMPSAPIESATAERMLEDNQAPAAVAALAAEDESEAGTPMSAGTDVGGSEAPAPSRGDVRKPKTSTPSKGDVRKPKTPTPSKGDVTKPKTPTPTKGDVTKPKTPTPTRPPPPRTQDDDRRNEHEAEKRREQAKREAEKRREEDKREAEKRREEDKREAEKRREEDKRKKEGKDD